MKIPKTIRKAQPKEDTETELDILKNQQRNNIRGDQKARQNKQAWIKNPKKNQGWGRGEANWGAAHNLNENRKDAIKDTNKNPVNGDSEKQDQTWDSTDRAG